MNRREGAEGAKQCKLVFKLGFLCDLLSLIFPHQMEKYMNQKQNKWESDSRIDFAFEFLKLEPLAKRIVKSKENQKFKIFV